MKYLERLHIDVFGTQTVRKVILSIKPKHIQRIISGEKLYEYRKRIYKERTVTTIVVYASYPVCKIIGEFQVGEIIHESPGEIWEQTNGFSGIDEVAFSRYFAGLDKGFALEIVDFRLYEKPRDLSEVYSSPPPQSFAYCPVYKISGEFLVGR